MSNAGRPSLPIEVKQARGHIKQRMPDYKYVERVNGEPEPPTDLSEYALECWNKVVPVLRTRGQLSLDSLWSLIALCECYAEWKELRLDIRVEGRTYTSEMSYGSVERANPKVGMLADADRRFRMWLNEFGLTDGTRHKVASKPVDEDKDNPLERYGLN